MAVDEAARHQLFTALEQSLGEQPTSTLMSLLPPVGWADVATKDDLRALETRLLGEMDGLRGELRGEMGEIRGEMGGLRGEMGEFRGEMGELRGEIGELRGEMHAAMAHLETRLTSAMRTQLFAMVAAMTTISTLAVAAAAVV